MCLVTHFVKTFCFTVSSKRNSCSIWCVVFVRWSWFFFITAWGEYFWTGDDWSHVRGRGAVPTGTPKRRGAQGQRWIVILSVLLAEKKEGSFVCCQEEPLLQIPDWICTYSYVLLATFISWSIMLLQEGMNTCQLGFFRTLHDISTSPYIFARFRWYSMHNTKHFHTCITIIP